MDKFVAKAYRALNDANVRSATVYVSPTCTVRLTRRFRRGLKEFVLNVGKPNISARSFIKAALAAGEPFPVRKVQLRRYGN